MLGRTWGIAMQCFAFLGFAILAGPEAKAGFTPVNHAPAGPEWNHAAILGHAYGGTFVADGLDFTNGIVTALRDEDFGDAALQPLRWDAGDSSRLLARFEGDEPGFDLLEGDRGASIRDLLAASAEARQAGPNPDSVDPVVSYRLSEPDGGRKFVLFFEDVRYVEGPERDYNDLVVEVTAAAAGDAAPAPAAIPLPPAALSGLLMLLTGGLWNARASVRRWLMS